MGTTFVTAQVRIGNTVASKSDLAVPKVLSIKASRLNDYIQQLIQECNKVYVPNRSKEFESFPLLSLIDLADTKEEVLFQTVDDLPKKTVFNSKGVPLLIIIPETEVDEIGLNKFECLEKDQREKVEQFIKSVPRAASVLPEKKKVGK